MTNPDKVAFTLFGKDVYWYGILMATGIIIAIILALKEGKRKKLVGDTIIDLCLVIIPCGIVGARLYYVLCEFESYASDPISMLYIWEGGLAIYGAVIGGLIGAIIYSLIKKQRLLRLLDCVAPGLVLAQAIGRWGNFFNQEAFGSPVTDPNMLWFPYAVRIDLPHTFNGEFCSNPYHLATFFYESMWCLLIFIFIWLIRKKFKHDGDAVFTYALLYSFERMLVEGLRGDSLYLLNTDIRISQLLSAIAFAAILSFFIIRTIKEKRSGTLIWPKPESEMCAEALDGTKCDDTSPQSCETIADEVCDTHNGANDLTDTASDPSKLETESDEANHNNEENEDI